MSLNSLGMLVSLIVMIVSVCCMPKCHEHGAAAGIRRDASCHCGLPVSPGRGPYRVVQRKGPCVTSTQAR
jgi:hypothetical protein